MNPKRYRLYGGIDPGVSGAIAVIDVNNTCIELHDMPTRKKSGDGIVRREVDPILLNELFEGILLSHCEAIWAWFIERPFAIRPRGKGKIFPQVYISLGESFGIARALMDARFGMGEAVDPSRWKRDFKIGKDKMESLMTARAIFAGADIGKKKHHNRAEALLIARWGMIFGRS